MICPKCKKTISDQSSFCRYCGQDLSVSSAAIQTASLSKKIRFLKVTAIGAIIACTAIGSAFFFFQPSNDNYQETILLAEKYLLEMDLEKAEEYYLLAKKIEPKKSESYEKLYEVYTKQNDSEKAKEVIREAKETLKDSDYQKVEENTVKIAKNSEANKPDAGNEPVVHEIQAAPVSEIGKLDRAPIEIGKKGWLIQQNGKYGLLDEHGTISAEPTGISFQEGISYDQKAFACLYGEGKSKLSNPAGHISEDVSTQQNGCDSAIFGVANLGIYILNDKNEISFYLPQEESGGGYTEDAVIQRANKPILVPKNPVTTGKSSAKIFEDSFDNKEFYIYNSAENKVYGPYEPNEIPVFNKLELNDENFNLLQKKDYYSQLIDSPFYVKSNGKYSVYSADGSKHKDGFDQVEIISRQAIGVHEDNLFRLLDANLNEIYSGPYESGGVPINNLVPVKQKDTWKFIAYDSVKNGVPVKETAEKTDNQSAKETEKKENQNVKNGISQKKETEPKSKASSDPENKTNEHPNSKFDFSDFSGRFERIQDDDSEIETIDITEKGDFDFYHSSLNPQKTGPDFPKGQVTLCAFKGKLILSRNESNQLTITMSEIAMENKAGTAETMDGFEFFYLSSEDIGLSTSQALTIYPAGTLQDDLDQKTLNLIQKSHPASVKDGRLMQPILSQKELIYIRNQF